MERKNNLNKRGQVTIFIILALILVVAIVLVFVLIKPPVLTPLDAENPQQYIQSCVRDALEDELNTALPRGGFIEPSPSRVFENQHILYLCYTNAKYAKCINQHPMYIDEIKNDIKNYVDPAVNECFASLKEKLQKKNYNIEDSEHTTQINLAPQVVQARISKKFYMTKNGETFKYDNFDVATMNPIYDLALTAQEIANQEAKYCNFEYVGFMALYPKYSIDKFQTGDGDKIYTITEKASGKKLVIAVRSCYMGAGF